MEKTYQILGLEKSYVMFEVRANTKKQALENLHNGEYDVVQDYVPGFSENNETEIIRVEVLK